MIESCAHGTQLSDIRSHEELQAALAAQTLQSHWRNTVHRIEKVSVFRSDLQTGTRPYKYDRGQDSEKAKIDANQ
jgi:hypothetical protein